jgi:hypothetical protein
MWKYKQIADYFEISTDEIFILHKETCLWSPVYWSLELCITSTQLLKCSAIKNLFKIGVNLRRYKFLVWHTQPWGNNGITVSLQSLKFQDPSFDSSSCSTRAYPAEFYSGPSWVQILPARLPLHRNFCKNVSEVPAFLISRINHQTVVPHCGSTIACNSKQIFESEIRSGGGWGCGLGANNKFATVGL